jgi:hypothetical protein
MIFETVRKTFFGWVSGSELALHTTLIPDRGFGGYVDVS